MTRIIAKLTKLTLLIFATSLLTELQASNENDTLRSSAYFDLNACDASISGGNGKYDEFVAVTSADPGACSIDVIGDHLYRDNPTVNVHSCTPGVGGSPGMCFGYDTGCSFDPSSDRAVKINVTLTPGPTGQSKLSGLTFYEQAIDEYIWIGGASGSNNWPTKFAVVVLKEGIEIYSVDTFSTTDSWSLVELDFTNDSNFEISEATDFQIQLFGYCQIGNGASVSVWDLDEISVFSQCPISAVDGGVLEGGPFAFCVGDGDEDHVSGITLSDNQSTFSQYVVTDDQNNILGLPGNPEDVNFDEAPAGICLIWHLSHEDDLTGLEMGNNLDTDLAGCYDLSNSITVTRNSPLGGELSGGPFTFCVGDGVEDHVSGVELTGNSGGNSQYLVTDDLGNILGLPGAPEDVNFDEAPAGVCLIWHLSYEDGLTGLEMGNNAMTDLVGCFDLSNAIEVVRNSPVGGELSGGPFTFCVGDGVEDHVSGVELTGNSGGNSQYLVTDDLGNILGLPGAPEDVNFDEAPAGVCLIWHLSYEDGLTGLEMGNNAMTDLVGCFDLSNAIEVVRNSPVGGELSGGPFTFCVGDGVEDHVSGVELTGNSGGNSQYLVTDDLGNILGLPGAPEDVNFDEAPAGVCLIWHLSYEDGLTGLEMGNNAMTDLVGCFDLSNAIEVVRNSPVGGELSGGPFTFCVGDGVEDHVSGVELTGNSGGNSQYLVTDDLGNILGLPGAPEDVNFDEAPAGVCLIWHLSYEDGLTGLEMGNNAMTDLVGCFDLSNAIEVVRNSPVGGELSGGPFTFCVGDGVEDHVSGVELTGNSGGNSQYLVTDDLGNILGLPGAPEDVNFDEAPAGVCLIWHLSYEDGLTGLEMGNNAMTDLVGCFDLSNAIEVVRNSPVGGELSGGPFTFCVGDGVEDHVSGVELTGNSGGNSQYLVTDDLGNILGLPGAPEDVNFDEAPAGVCLIWHLSYEDGLTGLEMGNNIMTDLVGCFDFSNSVSVNRTDAMSLNLDGGELSGGPFEFCVGDGIADHVSGVMLSGNMGSNSQYVVTDDLNNILGLPSMPGDVNFDEAPAGVCLIWHLSYEDGLIGLNMGNNVITDLAGCFDLSNAIEVIRNSPVGGELTGGPFTFCVGDGVADHVSGVDLAGNSGGNSQYVVTDDLGNILGLPGAPEDVNFDEAPAGVCLIWHLSYEDGLTGLEMGNNAMTDLVGCFDFSNSITVNRASPEGGMIAGGPFEFCVGDATADNIPVGGISLTGNVGANSQWVVTNEQGTTILGLPPSYEAVNFDEAPAGVCLVWHLSYEDGLEGLEMGNDLTMDLIGCSSLSNSVMVIRKSAEGGTLEGGPFSFCVGDGVPDMVSGVTLSGNTGDNSQYVITDDQGMILGLPGLPEDVDFDMAPAGTCFIHHLSYADGLTGLMMGNNINTDLIGCFDFSNSIEVDRMDCGGGNPAIIVLNEINSNGDVELKNIGGTAMDISTYWLCIFPSYVMIANTTIVCGGDMILDSGELVTVDPGLSLGSADGELGLYTTNSFGDSGSIIDYVEWGSTGHMRSTVAVAAGIWTTGDFASTWSSPNSLEYDGAGDAGADWSEDAPTACTDNLGANDDPIFLKIFPNPAVDQLQFNIVTESGIPGTIEVYDLYGKLVYSRASSNIHEERLADIAHLLNGKYYMRVVSHESSVTKGFIKTE